MPIYVLIEILDTVRYSKRPEISTFMQDYYYVLDFNVAKGIASNKYGQRFYQVKWRKSSYSSSYYSPT